MYWLSLFLVIFSMKAYQFFDKDGKAVDFEQVVARVTDADVILFGEIHNDPIHHWLQLQLTKTLYAQKDTNLILAGEMFEADDQIVLDEFLAGLLTDKNLDQEAKLWPNYATDYAPIVNFARQKGLHFVASNVPRRYASLVSRQGLPILETLGDEAQAYLPPLPITVDMSLPGYKNMIDMMGGHGMHGGAMRAEHFVQAQAIKDATMAHRILAAHTSGKQVLHFNGTYHSNNFEGIVWYLKQARPELKIATISAATQDQLERLEANNEGLANFILVTPKDMIKTH